MRMRFTWAFGACAVGVTMMVALEARQATSAEAALETARKVDVVDGDLAGAIAQYREVTETYKVTNRSVAAQALVQMARAYARMGDTAAARGSYTRVVNEFGDRPEEVRVARTALGPALAAQAAPQDELRLRKVMDGGSEGAVSPDGRYLTQNNGVGNDLILRDLTTKSERTLYRGSVLESVFAKDGSQIAFSGDGVRILNLRDGATATPRLIFPEPENTYVGVLDWSPDGATLAVYLQRRADRVLQLALVSVPAGKLQVLKTVEWGGAFRAMFSPDGHDLAFGARVDADNGNSDVYLMALDSMRETPLVEHPGSDVPLAWTPDGRHLLFRSSRTGANGLYAQAVAGRRPAGLPQLVKADIGANVTANGMTRDGVLYLGVRTFTQDVEVAPIPSATGGARPNPTRPIRTAAERNFLPTWTRDGRSLAYVSFRREGLTIGIRSTDTGVERSLLISPQTSRAEGLSWAPDGLSLVAWGQDPRGRYGLFRIDAGSGVVTPIELRDPPVVGLEGYGWSPDGSRMYYRGIYSGTILERDVASGRERVVALGNSREGEDEANRRFNRWYGPISVSPDGLWIATSRADASTDTSSLLLVPVDRGQPRELLRVSAPDVFDPYIAAPQWMPDGRSLVALKVLGEGTAEFWNVPIDGSAARKLDVDANRLAADFRVFRVHPNGREIAYVAGEDRNEVWALENLLGSLAGR